MRVILPVFLLFSACATQLPDGVDAGTTPVDLVIHDLEPDAIPSNEWREHLLRVTASNACAQPVVRVEGQRLEVATAGSDELVAIPTGDAFAKALAAAGRVPLPCGEVAQVRIEVDCTGQEPLMRNWSGLPGVYVNAVASVILRLDVPVVDFTFGPVGDDVSPWAQGYVRVPLPVPEDTSGSVFEVDGASLIFKRGYKPDELWSAPPPPDALLRYPGVALAEGTSLVARLAVGPEGLRFDGGGCLSGQGVHEWSWKVRTDDVPRLRLRTAPLPGRRVTVTWEDVGGWQYAVEARRPGHRPEFFLKGTGPEGVTFDLTRERWCFWAETELENGMPLGGEACVEASEFP